MVTNRSPAIKRRLWPSFSTGGVLIGTLFFAASLTPTLLPRTFLTQGVLSGCSLAAGYGIGVFGVWLWDYMELVQLTGRFLRVVKLAAATGCAIVAIISLSQMAQWQNSIRELMKLEPVDTVYPLEVSLIALTVFAILIALARLFRLTLRFVATSVNRFLPGRVSNVIGVIAAVALFWSVINGVLFRAVLHVAEASFREYDAMIEPETPPPTDPLKTGSNASLLAWDKLGRAGREFISSGPTREDISTLSGRRALEPIRAYVGLRSAATPERRAKLALEELKRVGGFERSVLIVVTPTGTGWVDPAAIDSVEYLHDGDVASVALQYSYLASWLYLLVDPGYGAEVARALFKEIYGYWTTLPRGNRPRLYLHGISLGATNSEQSTDLIEVMGDPFDGALWSGPPYSSRLWRWLTDHRNPGSPAWLPRFRDGSFVRFMNQHGEAAEPPGPNAPWGPVRIVYLQYASDPATFFDYRSLYREPDWMQPPRGPDVSPQLRWYPVVTLFQLMLDMFMATEAPIGYGHVYAPAHYIDAWIEVTDVRDWAPEGITRLKQHLSKPQSAAAIGPTPSAAGTLE
ncbi:alpha/beta-hydrolase family protein [Bradyrhizobium sp. Arg237L]|uniref:alpha/beta hydrolase n=1 Tax=Bradyrhizobium sp. Arg237L TaxID=3003352 RepID=UPI00249DDAD7|nr:alpha/beta-hydrolase family protein [Bradyrhizobium sp. Arg237L]MDI4231666.1 alpha/beta-hydrolase family protein [Bradyrhizobium sp. Arg237L]